MPLLSGGACSALVAGLPCVLMISAPPVPDWDLYHVTSVLVKPYVTAALFPTLTRWRNSAKLLAHMPPRKTTRKKTKRLASPDRIWIGDCIRRWRKDTPRSLTREELASELGHRLSELLGADVSRCLSTLRKWEKGMSEPHASELLAMDLLKPGLLDQLRRASSQHLRQ
jgi:DNA-binding transcriptional regulator YiaG